MLLIRSPNLCYATQAPSCGPPRGGFHFGLVVYPILLVLPLWGILPASLSQQGLSGNSLCIRRRMILSSLPIQSSAGGVLQAQDNPPEAWSIYILERAAGLLPDRVIEPFRHVVVGLAERSGLHLRVTKGPGPVAPPS